MKKFDPVQKAKWDNYAALETAREEGFRKGIEIGEKMALAKLLKEEKILTETIVRITDLSLDQINKL